MEKKLQVLFIFLFSVQIFSQTATAPSGSGSSGDPYLIASINNLYWLSQNSSIWNAGKYFKQTADIDASASSGWNGGKGFLPIGNATTKFKGYYDGQGYTISNLYIKRNFDASDNSDWYMALFGFVEEGEISNIGMLNADITGDHYVGALVGRTSSTVNISNCYSTGNITSTGDYAYCAGGLVGGNDEGSISECYSICSVSGKKNVGGLVGDNSSDNATITVNKCYSAGSVTGNGDNVGGFVGSNTCNEGGSVSIINCYSTGSVSGSKNTGGFAGQNYDVGYGGSATITNCYSTGSVSGSTNIGGFLGINDIEDDESSITVTGCYWDNQNSNQTIGCGSNEGGAFSAAGLTTAQMKVQSNFSGWDFATTPIWKINSSLNNGYPYLAWAESVDSNLPVELTTFTASIIEEGIKLNWETATEVNNYGFDIQRSVISNQLSEKEFETIGFVEGCGNSNSPKSYEYIDTDVPAGEVEYRLKQIDTEGGFEYYSTTAKVDYNITDVNGAKELPTEFALEQNYPNPFNPSTTILYSIPVGDGLKPSPTNVTLIVYDMLGREVAALVNKEQAAGSYSINFDASKLSSGMYIYRIQAGEFVQARKMLLLR